MREFLFRMIELIGGDYDPAIRAAITIGSSIFIISAASVFWNFRLRKEINKQKKTQEDLEQAKQEAETANNIKSSFLARMSHEIRTPLNAITGMSYLLSKTSVTLTQKMYIDRVTQASTNMLSIVNDILDFSKIEAGKVELENISFSLDQVIQNVINIVSYKIEEQEIGFKLIKDPLISNWFFGDAKRIEQILINIINNAIKFTASGEVSLNIMLVSKEIDKCHLSLIIKDTGIGMSEDQVKQLFEPFIQGDISINRRFGGTGLGLSIVKNLVEMMNGKIQVYSTEGEGSSFVITLPFKIDTIKEEEHKKQVFSNYFNNIKTLVLEKNAASMNIIDSYLGAFGMDCELTTSPEIASNMLETANDKFSRPYDLFVLDFNTPPEGGFNYVQALRQNNRIARMPKIIMMLPMTKEDLFDRLEEFGVDIGIGKPIIPSILFNEILELFEIKDITANEFFEKGAAVTNDSAEVPGCVLIAEDNKTNQLIAKTLLQQSGLITLVASDGKAAVDVFNVHREEVDLVLMDLHMPVMNGYDAAKEIRNISGTVPIVAMTADVILGVREKCEAHGIHYYISKPFAPEYLMKTIKDIIKEYRNKNNKDPGILDRAAGLRNLGGNEQLYQSVLHEYLDENRNIAKKLSLEIDENRYSDASQTVHKIKSSSGSIGAKKLYDSAVSLQQALMEKDESGIEALQRKFIALIEELLQEIGSDT